MTDNKIRRHSGENNPKHPQRQYYAPRRIATVAQLVMGGIDLDPASCAEANRVVGASAFFTTADDGLSRSWSGRVFCNPPGGKLNGQSQMLLYWNKLTAEYRAGNVYSAIFLGFTPAPIYMSQDGDSVLNYPICLPRKRIAFLAPTKTGELKSQGAPPHHNFLSFLPPRDADYHSSLHRFFHYTRELGWCGIPQAFTDAQFVPGGSV